MARFCQGKMKWNQGSLQPDPDYAAKPSLMVISIQSSELTAPSLPPSHRTKKSPFPGNLSLTHFKEMELNWEVIEKER